MNTTIPVWIKTSICALFFLGCSFLPIVAVPMDMIYGVSRQTRAEFFFVVSQEWKTIVSFSNRDKQMLQLLELEQDNRHLSSQLVAALQREHVLQQIASESGIIEDPRLTQGIVSRDIRGWFVVLANTLPIPAGARVYRNGVYVGEVLKEGTFVVPLSLVSSLATPLLVTHQPSGKVGTLTRSGTTLQIEFFERIEGLQPGDRFVTLPSRHTTTVAPVGTLHDVLTSVADPVSKALVKLTTQVSIGDLVEVER